MSSKCVQVGACSSRFSLSLPIRFARRALRASLPHSVLSSYLHPLYSSASRARRDKSRHAPRSRKHIFMTRDDVPEDQWTTGGDRSPDRSSTPRNAHNDKSAGQQRRTQQQRPEPIRQHRQQYLPAFPPVSLAQFTGIPGPSMNAAQYPNTHQHPVAFYGGPPYPFTTYPAPGGGYLSIPTLNGADEESIEADVLREKPRRKRPRDVPLIDTQNTSTKHFCNEREGYTVMTAKERPKRSASLPTIPNRSKHTNDIAQELMNKSAKKSSTTRSGENSAVKRGKPEGIPLTYMKRTPPNKRGG